MLFAVVISYCCDVLEDDYMSGVRHNSSAS